MIGPIYKLWMCRPTESWYRMSQEERDAYIARSQEALQRVGGKTIVTLTPLWSNKRWVLAGVEEFPDIDAVYKHAEILFFQDHYRFIESFSILGVRWPPDDSAQTLRPTMESPVFKVWMMRLPEAWYALSQEERNANGARAAQILEQAGGNQIIVCACGWSNEQWVLFGVEEFPSVEATQRHTDLLFANDHFRYSDGVSMLGTLWRTE